MKKLLLIVLLAPTVCLAQTYEKKDGKVYVVVNKEIDSRHADELIANKKGLLAEIELNLQKNAMYQQAIIAIDQKLIEINTLGVQPTPIETVEEPVERL